MRRILIIEDDTYISDMLCTLLMQHGYQPTPAYSGTEALLRIDAAAYDLILLDLMLPGKSGADVLTAVRRSSNTPVIALTALHDKASVVELLRLGANDYITKPFDNEELLARIEVQLRSSRDQNGGGVTYKDIALDTDAYDAYISGRRAGLSKKEYEILWLLISNPRKVFTKNNLYESVWQGEYLGDDNTVNVHISRIRAKLAALHPDAEYIQTVWGIGFKMRE